MMVAPVVLAFVVSAFESVVWRAASAASYQTDEDVESAMDLFRHIATPGGAEEDEDDAKPGGHRKVKRIKLEDF